MENTLVLSDLIRCYLDEYSKRNSINPVKMNDQMFLNHLTDKKIDIEFLKPSNRNNFRQAKEACYYGK
jgi:hypothetical protein